VNIAIVGGGATGVELSAELHNAVKQLHSYGYKGLTNEALNVTLVKRVSVFCLRCRRVFPVRRTMS
jgi:NADH dehydrogenase FAD-containing subunit